MYSFISFGTRCNSAIILRWLLEIQKKSLPFDWVQMNINTQLDIMNLFKDQYRTEAFYSYLFTDLFNKDEKKSYEGSWFPHDDFDDINIVVQKYVRRTYRLFNILSNDKIKIFLMLYQYNNIQNKHNLEKIIESLDNLNINYKIITINALDTDIITDKHINLNVHFNLILGNDKDYDNWNMEIINKLNTLDIINSLIK